jgi:hypothetical protein
MNSNEIASWKQTLDAVGIDCSRMDTYAMYHTNNLVETDELVERRANPRNGDPRTPIMDVLRALTSQERIAVRERCTGVLKIRSEKGKP